MSLHASPCVTDVYTKRTHPLEQRRNIGECWGALGSSLNLTIAQGNHNRGGERRVLRVSNFWQANLTVLSVKQLFSIKLEPLC